VLAQAVEKALAPLARRPRAVIDRRAQVERELAQVQQRLDRLIDVLADGSLPADEIKARLRAEKARKTVLSEDLEKLGRVVRSPACRSRKSPAGSAPVSAPLRAGANVRVGGWDPYERLKDQAYDSISAEVLYPTRGAVAWVTGDPELEEACCRA